MADLLALLDILLRSLLRISEILFFQ